MFSAMCKETYSKGKVMVVHKDPIAEADLEKLYASVAFNINTPCGLLNKGLGSRIMLFGPKFFIFSNLRNGLDIYIFRNFNLPRFHLWDSIWQS